MITNFPKTIFLITESWLNSSVPDGFFLHILGTHIVVRCDRLLQEPGSVRGGGVIVIIPKVIHISCVKQNVEQTSFFESLWIDFYDSKKKLFVLALYYRTPSSDAKNSVDALVSHIRKNPVLSGKAPLIVCGDFNFPSLKWVENGIGNENEELFSDLIMEVGLQQFVKNSTHTAGNILDLVFTSEPALISELCVDESLGISDHYAVLFSINLWSNESANEKSLRFRNFEKANYTEISKCLLSTNWESVFSSCLNVDDMCEFFLSIINNLIMQFVPLCPVHCGKFMWSGHAQYWHRRQRRLHAKFKKSKSMEDKSQWHQAAKEARRSKRKDLYKYENEILKSGCDKRFWNYVKSRVRTKSDIPPVFDLDGNLKIKNKEKAEIFNQYFASVYINDNGVDFYPKRYHVNSIKKPTFDAATVYSHICSLSPKNSFGPDKIPQKFIVNLAFELAYPLSIIYSLSFSSSVVPKDWKKATVCPIFKKGIASMVQNYRPISLLVTMSKANESIMRDVLIEHLKGNKIISPNQHGFQSGRSTVTQLLVCMHDWVEAIDKNKVIDIIYIDIAKAFDSVSHRKLLLVMESMSFHPQIVNWVKDYLSERCQYVEIEGEASQVNSITSGVPQGSLIGPVLFLIYINSLVDCVHNAKLLLYADDAKLYFSVERFTENLFLQDDFLRVCKWVQYYQLEIALSKCFVVHIGYGNFNTIYINENTILPVVNKFKDLGITFTNDLKSTSYCNELYQKAFRTACMIFKVFHCHDERFLIQMYKTYVRSKVEYATEIWSPSQIGDIDRIERVQRMFTKRLPGLQNFSYVERLSKLSLESLEQRRIIRDLIFVYKMLFNLVDLSFENFFQLKHRENAREVNPYQLFLPRVYKKPMSDYFAVRVIPIWNNLPAEVFSKNSLSNFRIHLTKLDFSQFLRGSAQTGQSVLPNDVFIWECHKSYIKMSSIY